MIHVKQKYITNQYYIMSNAQPAVFQVIREIVKQGKQVLRDHYVSREKVPTYARRYSSKKIQQSIIQDGNQSEVKRRYSHFSLKMEQPPKTILKDNMAKNSTKFAKGMKNVQENQSKSPDRSKTTNNRFYSSKKKNEINNSPHKFVEDKQNPQMRQNTFLKLEEDHGNRKVAERAKKREQQRQDVMREQKRQMMVWQYQQKLQNEAFLKERENRYLQKEKMLQDHLKKGKQFKYCYDSSGDLLLFESNNRKDQKYPPQTVYKVVNDNEEDEFIQDYDDYNGDLRRQQSLGYKKPLQNQRIRSARGQAFASAVLRTVNMSKMSINGSVIQVDPQQFMKRNDLFNNNHSRQTTNIPFLQPKIGTVYTQIATNQIATNKNSPSTAANYQDDVSVESRYKNRKFQPFQRQERMSKTARDITKQEQLAEEAVRPIRSSQEGQRRGSVTERRPYTSTHRSVRGKITANNYHLVQSLLQ